ncbi:ABC transporter ATP-binding protein [Streptantibioticus parmotrematis]|uniref:ABC transporter ATP-binding protein n=1 Tax=Streptantibioticus parmotrematis TaxID=2873249 RepID=UPI0033D1CA55
MTRGQALRWLFGLSWQRHRGWVLTFVVLAVADVLATGVFALTLRMLIQSALDQHLREAVIATVGAALSYAVTIVGASARLNVVNLLDEAVGVDLDERILGLIAGLDGIEHLERPEYADRIALVRGSGDVIARCGWVLLDGVTMLVRLLVVLAILTMTAPVLLILVLLLVPALWLPRRGQRGVRAASVAVSQDVRRVEHIQTLLTEATPNMEVRIAGAGPRLLGDGREVWDRIIRTQARAQWRNAGLGITGWAVFVLGYVAALLFIVHDVASGREQPGDVLLLVTLTNTLRAQAEGVMRSLQRTTDGMSALDAFLWLEDHAAAHRGTAGTAGVVARVPERLTDGITLSGVSFRYPGTDRWVFRGIDLRLPAGSTVAVVGEHGAGKTSLVKLLTKFYEPAEGVVTVDGVRLDEIPAEDWWSRTTANFQDFARFLFLVRESVGVGDLAAADRPDVLARAIADADAEGIVAGLPDGLDTQLGRVFDGQELSTGQWQRIALSRAHMRTAPLLCVIDEPTASLDPRSEYAVYRRQMKLAKSLGERFGTVTLVVSHRFSTVQMADLIVVVEDGAVAEMGDHDELMALGGLYADLFRMQAAAFQNG